MQPHNRNYHDSATPFSHAERSIHGRTLLFEEVISRCLTFSISIDTGNKRQLNTYTIPIKLHSPYMSPWFQSNNSHYFSLNFHSILLTLRYATTLIVNKRSKTALVNKHSPSLQTLYLRLCKPYIFAYRSLYYIQSTMATNYPALHSSYSPKFYALSQCGQIRSIDTLILPA